MRFPLSSGFCIILLAVSVTGCSPMRYSQFTGRNTVWPTTAGVMAETAYAIPVYRGFPERPYEVIGSVRFENPRKYWDDGVIRMAAHEGKRNGGDAIIFRSGSAVPSSWLDQFTGRPTGYGEEQTALVIKWTPESVINSRKADEERFWANFRQRFPALSDNDQVFQLATSHLIEMGVKPYSPEMEERLSQVLGEIRKQPRETLAGKWLVKGAVQTSSITSSSGAENFFGLATVVTSGTKITMISTAGKAEFNFSGSVEAGQLSGLLGFGGKASSLSAKCDGVALNEKISLTFQKLTDNGTVQGSVTLQR
ncbi:MAG: hypothetical protein EXS31_07850 [Pedosphaera sp.]|nr:hypothetical protein [Pedosphaera sp.]